MTKDAAEAAKRMMALFSGFAGAHGTHGRPTRRQGALKAEIKTTAKTVRSPVTLELWQEHLAGRKPLGVIPIRDDGTCVWGSIDYDVYDVDLTKMIRRVEELELPLVPCRSKSGGLHLWLFLSAPAPAADVVSLLREVAAAIGAAGSEIFPKQTEILTDRGDTGNWMVMPYYGDTYGGLISEQAGLKKTGAEMTVDEFLRAAEKARVTPEALHALAEQASRAPSSGVPKVRVASGASGASAPGVLSSSDDFSNGPPCLQHLVAAGVLAEGRKRTLFMMGIYAKRANPTGWREDLERYNQEHMKPPLDADEVQGVKKSLGKKDYFYTCRTEPMQSYCNSALCRTRALGVGEEGEYPRLYGLSVLNTQPPMWFVDVDDARVDMSTEELVNYRLFHKVMAERRFRCYRPMKQDDWIGALGNAMKKVVVIEAPPDVGRRGRFGELLEEFLTNRNVGQNKEDLLNGRPYEDETTDRYYFRLRDLHEFCDRAKFTELNRTQMGQEIEAVGGGRDFYNLKGRGTNVRWIPRKAVSRPEPLDTPPVKRSQV